MLVLQFSNTAYTLPNWIMPNSVVRPHPIKGSYSTIRKDYVQFYSRQACRAQKELMNKNRQVQIQVQTKRYAMNQKSWHILEHNLWQWDIFTVPGICCCCRCYQAVKNTDCYRPNWTTEQSDLWIKSKGSGTGKTTRPNINIQRNHHNCPWLINLYAN